MVDFQARGSIADGVTMYLGTLNDQVTYICCEGKHREELHGLLFKWSKLSRLLGDEKAY